MESLFSFVPDVLYQSIYISVIFGLCLIIAINYSFSIANEKLTAHLPLAQIGAFALTVLVILFIGFRPVSSVFIDMSMYTHVYNNIYDGLSAVEDTRGEWLFYAFGNFCKRIGLSDTMYILSIAVIYFSLMLVACWRLMRNNLFVAILFCLASFSCFAYGVNGLRNGMACSLVMVGVSLLSGKLWEKILALALMLCAYFIHHSTALPCFCALAALLVVKDTKLAIYFWIASIFISMIAGNYVTDFFINIGVDERMQGYANLDEFGGVRQSENIKAGFRFDFIIYSIMPIIMVWYVTIKRNFRDLTYHIIATTYILANAFWVMVIRSEQSNRFAYLSWFIYPLVVAYPLLRMNIWEDQDRKTGLILLIYSGFTFFMNFIYYG